MIKSKVHDTLSQILYLNALIQK